MRLQYFLFLAERRHCSRFSLRTRTNSDDDSSQSDVIDDSDAEEQKSSEESVFLQIYDFINYLQPFIDILMLFQ